jgi:hypothetical protein
MPFIEHLLFHLHPFQTSCLLVPELPYFREYVITLLPGQGQFQYMSPRTGLVIISNSIRKVAKVPHDSQSQTELFIAL